VTESESLLPRTVTAHRLGCIHSVTDSDYTVTKLSEVTEYGHGFKLLTQVTRWRDSGRARLSHPSRDRHRVTSLWH
jgi:hypothetical protein